MKWEQVSSKALTWCEEHPLLLSWFGGSIIMSIGVGMLSSSVGGAILSLGICILLATIITAID
ncbi:hypothetical protein LCGC14_1765920 [marine sediment metagenome]|uniref:Uncharacterized protein n=1 Tax=marine sediment metagenome TaxID=412755 RepID=A0A0F9HM78_9ZZZZ